MPSASFHTDLTKVDPQPVRIKVDKATGAIATTSAGSFNVPSYDSFDVAYVASGNGAGEIETITYKQGGTTVATVTFTYNSDNKVTSATLS